jgi:dihydrolipoamide dehydrogenase
MDEILDVIIIGAGSAGLSALREVEKRTHNFVIINDGPWGTVCARVGCMPSKTLIEAANAFYRRRTFDEFGIRGSEHLRLDIAAALGRVRRLRDSFVASTLQATEALGERAISGRARLLGIERLEGRLEVTLEVKGQDLRGRELRGRELRARSIIIATGSRPVIPASWQGFSKQVLTTDTLFEQETLPSRMAVLGLGPIGVEMAQALSRLDLDVDAFSESTTVAGLTDPEVNTIAEELLRHEFPLHLGEKAHLDIFDSSVRVTAGTEKVVVGSVLAALGRQPNVDDLGLETLGIELNEQGLPPVNPHTKQVGDVPVFMAGDADGHIPLLHEAADDGHIAGINAMRASPFCFARRVPLTIVFSDPGIAMVGSSFQSLEPKNILTGEVRFEHQSRAWAAQRNKGILRLYAEPESGRLLGAEMCAPAAEHMAHLLALAVERSLTVRDMLRLPVYHPVLEEGLRTALRDLARKLPAAIESDLAACEPLNAEALE